MKRKTILLFILLVNGSLMGQSLSDLRDTRSEMVDPGSESSVSFVSSNQLTEDENRAESVTNNCNSVDSLPLEFIHSYMKGGGIEIDVDSKNKKINIYMRNVSQKCFSDKYVYFNHKISEVSGSSSHLLELKIRNQEAFKECLVSEQSDRKWLTHNEESPCKSSADKKKCVSKHLKYQKVYSHSVKLPADTDTSGPVYFSSTGALNRNKVQYEHVSNLAPCTMVEKLKQGVVHYQSESDKRFFKACKEKDLGDIFEMYGLEEYKNRSNDISKIEENLLAFNPEVQELLQKIKDKKLDEVSLESLKKLHDGFISEVIEEIKRRDQKGEDTSSLVAALETIYKDIFKDTVLIETLETENKFDEAELANLIRLKVKGYSQLGKKRGPSDQRGGNWGVKDIAALIERNQDHYLEKLPKKVAQYERRTGQRVDSEQAYEMALDFKQLAQDRVESYKSSLTYMSQKRQKCMTARCQQRWTERMKTAYEDLSQLHEEDLERYNHYMTLAQEYKKDENVGSQYIVKHENVGLELDETKKSELQESAEEFDREYINRREKIGVNPSLLTDTDDDRMQFNGGAPNFNNQPGGNQLAFPGASNGRPGFNQMPSFNQPTGFGYNMFNQMPGRQPTGYMGMNNNFGMSGGSYYPSSGYNTGLFANAGGGPNYMGYGQVGMQQPRW